MDFFDQKLKFVHTFESESFKMMANPKQEENKNAKNGRKPVRGYTRTKNIVFALMWIYVFGKVFIADVETYLFRTYNLQESWILNYRFLILLIASMLLWYWMGFWRFIKNVGLFLLYPFKILFWNIPVIFGYRIPAKMFNSKQYILLFGYVESVIQFFRNFRWSILINSVTLLGVLIIFNTNSDYLLYASMIILGCYLVLHFFKRVKYAINPLGVTINNAKFLESRKDDAFIPKLVISEREKTDEEAIRKRKDEHIQSIVGSKYLMQFVAQQVDKYSKLTFLLLTTVKLIGTFTLSIIVCALMSYALYRIDPEFYSSELSNQITFIDFMVYGFFNVAPDGIYIEPTTRLGWIMKTVFGYVGVVCIGILLVSIFTAVTSTFEPIITKSVKILLEKSSKVATYLESEYGMSEDQAIEYLNSQNESKTEFIRELKKLVN